MQYHFLLCTSKFINLLGFFSLSFSSFVLCHGNDINHRYSTFISVFSSVAWHLTWNIECQINVYSMRVTFQSCSTTIVQFKCHRQQKLLVWNRISIQPTNQRATASEWIHGTVRSKLANYESINLRFSAASTPIAVTETAVTKGLKYRNSYNMDWCGKKERKITHTHWKCFTMV